MRSWVKVSLLSLTVIYLSGCVAAAPMIAIGAAGAGSANVAGSSVGVSQQYSDLTIKSDIATILTNTKDLNGANVEVTVFNGIVLLLGQIPSQDLKDQLASQVSQIEGVVIVYNQLTIGPNVTFTRFADDGWITSKVKANMVGKINPLHFKVVTQEGVVYLLGQVTTDEGDQAAQIAAQTSGVVKVVKIFNYIYPSAATPATVPGVASADASLPPTSSTNPVPAVSGSSEVSTSPDTAISPVANPSSIPQYAPSYAAPDNGAGSSASD